MAEVLYHAVPTDWWREEKYRFLDGKEDVARIEWQMLEPDDKHTWLRAGMVDEFDTFLPLGTKLAKQMDVGGEGAIFKNYSLGVSTNRDSVVYDFDRVALVKRVEQFCDDYNAELARYESRGKPEDLDGFLDYGKVKWSRNLKRALRQGIRLEFDAKAIRTALYRPFTTLHLYFAETLVDEEAQMRVFFPEQAKGNRGIVVSDIGLRSAFSMFATDTISDLHLCASTDAFQCFPFYTYAEDGSERRENITDWALKEFQTRYGDKNISKWDIFHYVYAVLHHPRYRERYAANLRRELPRIPFVAAEVTRLTSKPGAKATKEDGASSRRLLQDAEVFHAFAKAGKILANLHVGYEQAKEYPLRRRENPKAQLNWRVEKMKLSKDKSALIYNGFLTLEGIPPETFAYLLGNRSALEWVIDQYQVSTDKRSGITNDPNRPDDPEYIVRLIGQVITVSLETVKLVKGLPSWEVFPAVSEKHPL